MKTALFNCKEAEDVFEPKVRGRLSVYPSPVTVRVYVPLTREAMFIGTNAVETDVVKEAVAVIGVIDLPSSLVPVIVRVTLMAFTIPQRLIATLNGLPGLRT